MDRETQRILDEIQENAAAYPTALAEAAVAACLAAGLLRPSEHRVDDAIAMYREVLAKLRETGGL